MRNTDMTAANDKRRAMYEEALSKIDNYAHKCPAGFTIKEAAIDLNIPGERARKQILNLVEAGKIAFKGLDGKSYVYIHTDFVTDDKAEEVQTETPPEEEGSGYGKFFDDARNITGVTPGDISWISSRSGNGEFFRYLICAVYPNKATVACVFPSTYPSLNLNDPNVIYVGEDPESGEELYVDLSNICQRRFDAFGEKCMVVRYELLEDVKERLARVFGITTHPVEIKTIEKMVKVNDDDKKAKIEKLEKKIKAMEVDYKSLNKKFEEQTDEYNTAVAMKANTVKENNRLRSALADSQDELSKLHEELRKKESNTNMDIFLECERLKVKVEMLEKHNSHLESIAYALSGVEVRIAKEGTV